MQTEKFSMAAQLKSFKYAFNGIKEFIITEHNARIHLTATIAVIVASFIFRISLHEAMMVAISIGMVWTAEMFNTCIEKIMDFMSVETHPAIKSIKDIAAGAVLVASIAAFVIGLIIFIPKIL
ncbi:MAG TPA: diacylglycerol kinase family protein [Puia sp.]|nr:diacylglycerol kinase family protein [Puia sp.]